LETKKYLDIGSLVVIIITLILFVVALFTKGLTHEILLEAGIFLVSVKLIIMAYKSIYSLPTKIKEDLPEFALEVYRDAYNFAWDTYEGDKDRSQRFAWRAVKKTITDMILKVNSN